MGKSCFKNNYYQTQIKKQKNSALDANDKLMETNNDSLIVNDFKENGNQYFTSVDDGKFLFYFIFNKY